MSNSFTSVFGAGSGADATKLPLTGGTLTGALTLPNAILSGLSLTGSQATNTIDVSTTWNTTGIPALIYGRVTDTASAFNSTLLDVGTVAGGYQFRIVKNALFGAYVAQFGCNNLLGSSGGRVAFGTSGNDVFLGSNTGTNVLLINASSNRAMLQASTGLVWSSGIVDQGATTSVGLFRAADATLQIGANHATTATAQTIKAHNVTTGTGADLILEGGTGSVASGNVRFGTHSAIGVELVTGYITIKDAGGTLRKLAVVS